MRLPVFITVFALLAALASPVLAQVPATQSGPHVKIRILPERGIIKPGEEFWVGIEQSIDKGWHTYWKNAGDSGSPPRAEWDLPEGFSIGAIEWPTPKKMSIGPLLNYGYENHVILLQKLKAPETLPQGLISLKTDIEVLVCKEECIPEYGTYELILNGPESGSEDNAAFLQAAAAQLPVAVEWSPTFSEEGGHFIVSIPDTEIVPAGFEFIPEDWGLIDNAAKPELGDKNGDADGGVFLKQKRGDRPLSALDETKGLLAYTAADGTRQSLAVTLKKAGAAAAPSTHTTMAVHTSISALFQTIILALLGGLILNLMPCVFPVLSMKALSLVKIAEKNPNLARKHGIAYTAGVIASFLIIAGTLIALKSGGSQIGWGFQLQNPVVVTGLAYLLFIIGLNFAGAFEVTGRFGNFGHKLTQGQGLSRTFFTGILATLVATPCTAPFMAGAVGYALVQPTIPALMIFASLGLGLALPYLILSFNPRLQKILPRPGAWMEIFRQFLAFPMFLSAAWLVWVISFQSGSMGVLGALIGMVAMAFSLWLTTHKPGHGFWRAFVRVLAVLSFLGALIIVPAGQKHMITDTQQKLEFGEAFSPEKLTDLLASNDPIFIEMTAAWCITCKVNHAVAIDTNATRTLFQKYNVQYLIGDWTNQDPAITKFLTDYGRSGVPIYVFYGARDENGQRPEAIVLPQILTPGTIQNLFNTSAKDD